MFQPNSNSTAPPQNETVSASSASTSQSSAAAAGPLFTPNANSTSTSSSHSSAKRALPKPINRLPTLRSGLGPNGGPGAPGGMGGRPGPPPLTFGTRGPQMSQLSGGVSNGSGSFLPAGFPSSQFPLRSTGGPTSPLPALGIASAMAASTAVASAAAASSTLASFPKLPPHRSSAAAASSTPPFTLGNGGGSTTFPAPPMTMGVRRSGPTVGSTNPAGLSGLTNGGGLGPMTGLRTPMGNGSVFPGPPPGSRYHHGHAPGANGITPVLPVLPGPPRSGASTIGRLASMSDTSMESGGGGNGGHVDVAKQRRKLRKNDREKQRRSEVNSKFEDLCQLLHLGKKSKTEKVCILTEAINHINILRAENAEMRLERTHMRIQIQKMEEDIKSLTARAGSANSGERDDVSTSNLRGDMSQGHAASPAAPDHHLSPALASSQTPHTYGSPFGGGNGTDDAMENGGNGEQLSVQSQKERDLPQFGSNHSNGVRMGGGKYRPRTHKSSNGGGSGGGKSSERFTFTNVERSGSGGDRSDSYSSSRSRERDSSMESRSNPQQAASPLSSPRRIRVSPSSHHAVTTRERRSMSSMFKHEPMSPRKRRSMSSTPDFEPRPRIHRRSDHTGGRFGGGGEMSMKSEMRRGGGLGAGKSVPMALVMGNVATPRGGGANAMKEEDVNADMNQSSSDTDASVLDDPNQTLLDHEDGNVDFASFDVKVKESFWNPPSVKNDNASAASASIFGFATPSQTSGNSSVSGHLTLPKTSDSASFSISGARHRQRTHSQSSTDSTNASSLSRLSMQVELPSSITGGGGGDHDTLGSSAISAGGGGVGIHTPSNNMGGLRLRTPGSRSHSRNPSLNGSSSRPGSLALQNHLHLSTFNQRRDSTEIFLDSMARSSGMHDLMGTNAASGMEDNEPMFSLSTLDHHHGGGSHKGAGVGASATDGNSGAGGSSHTDVDPFSLNPESSGIGGRSSAFGFDGESMSASASAFMMDLDSTV